MIKNILFVFIILIIILISFCSCFFDENHDVINFYEKKIVPDTTISVNEILNLDLREYYELRWDPSGSGSIEYPTIIPSVNDTSIAHLNYNHILDQQGKGFSIIGIRTGETVVQLNLSWWTCDGTVQAYEQRSFNLTVLDEL